MNINLDKVNALNIKNSKNLGGVKLINYNKEIYKNKNKHKNCKNYDLFALFT